MFSRTSQGRSYSAAALISLRASAGVAAMGFSLSTALPAARAANTYRGRYSIGVLMTTASTSGSEKSSSAVSTTVGMPAILANLTALDRVRVVQATTSIRSAEQFPRGRYTH